MKLEDQVVSLELAKRLKELGIKQDSLWFWWVLDENHTLFNVHKKTKTPERLQESLNGKIMYGEDLYKNMLGEYLHYSAFTASELGEILREFELTNALNLVIDMYNSYDFYNLVLKQNKVVGYDSVYVKDKTEANARAKMLIHILENGLMKWIK